MTLTGVRHVFPPGTVIEPSCGILVFGGGTPNGIFGGMPVQTASTNTLALNNAGDQISVKNGAITVVSYTYGTEGGNNTSLTRDPDLTGTDPLVQHTIASTSGGTSFSPGTKADGTAFSGCTSTRRRWSRGCRTISTSGGAATSASPTSRGARRPT